MKILLIFLCFYGIPITQVNEQHIGKTVEIRGFLYRGDNNQLFLAAEPNLKSCCVGKKQQILVADSLLEPQSQVIELSGQLDLKGDRLVLNDPKKIEKPPRDYLAAYLFGLGAIGGFLVFRRQKTKRHCNARR